MAKYGASYLYFAPFAEADPDTNAAKLPKYGTKVHLGSLITVADTPNVQSAEISGDNAVEDRVDEVADYDVSTSVTELENAVAAAVFGSNLSSDGDLSYSFDDESPQGGLGLISKRKYKGKVFYKGIFYPQGAGRASGRDLHHQGHIDPADGRRPELPRHGACLPQEQDRVQGP